MYVIKSRIVAAVSCVCEIKGATIIAYSHDIRQLHINLGPFFWHELA